MSNRTVESIKAVRLAWIKEKELVQEGKGTRDWSKEQQQSILDKGKAYDIDGKAFEGQHMKSVEEYPEYQDNPDNIQLLTRDEHFDAHKRNWQNPTNWYYNPETKEYVDFADGDIIPYNERITELSDPLVKNVAGDSQKANCKNGNNVGIKKRNIAKVFFNEFVNYVKHHPVEFVVTVAPLVYNFAHSIYSKCSNKNNIDIIKDTNEVNINQKTDVDNILRKTPCQNEVSQHSQHYHTKEGIIEKEIAPYKRGVDK